MNQNTPLPENLNTELEANVYRAIKAAQDSTPEALFTEIEKQVYNAIQAAGGTGGGGGGTAATIRVGTTTTLPPGSSATVTNSGTSSAAVFNFGIPAGERGEAGAAGPAGAQGAEGPAGTDGINGVDGKDGTAATITVGAVTTGAPETAAAVDNVGTSTAAIFNFTQRAVKPRPSGRGYKAHLNWNFCLSAFCMLTGDTAAGHAVSACGEIVRPGGIGGWFVPVKFPTWECLRRKPSLVPLGSLVESGTRLWRGSLEPLPIGIPRL